MTAAGVQSGLDWEGDARIAAGSAIAAGCVGLVSVGLFAAAFGFDVSVTSAAPDLASGVGAGRAGLLRWAALTDMVGFYVLVIPVVVHMGGRLYATGHRLAGTATACGLAYAVIGAIGAATLAAAAPPLLEAGTPEADAILDVLRRIVFVGLWQTLETLPLALWLAVAGSHLRRRWPALGWSAFVLAAGAALMAGGRMLAVEPLVAAATGPVIGGLAVWLLALGLSLRTDARSGRTLKPMDDRSS